MKIVGWTQSAAWGVCLLAGAVAAQGIPSSPEPRLQSSAQVTAMTVESQGREAGCVDWTYHVVPAPQNKQLRRVRLVFDFANRCGRRVSVVLAKQTFDGGGGAVYGQPVVLEPGAIQSYISSGKVGNYILFDPDPDRWLRFWVHQSDQRFRNGIYLDLARCNLKFPPPELRPPKPRHPECPPSMQFSIRTP